MRFCDYCQEEPTARAMNTEDGKVYLGLACYFREVQQANLDRDDQVLYEQFYEGV